MRLILVRHGETIENISRIMQGQTHGRLSEDGRIQIRKLSERLRDEKIDFAYSSDLQRCRDTAEEIMRYHKGVRIRYRKELREHGKGEFDGRPVSDTQSHLESIFVPFHEYKFPGGERFSDVWDRTINFMAGLIEKHKGQTVLVVSHGGPISCFLSYLNGIPIEDRRIMNPQNTAVSIIDLSDAGNHRVEKINCISHLDR